MKNQQEIIQGLRIINIIISVRLKYLKPFNYKQFREL